jgi:hypothetical protein
MPTPQTIGRIEALKAVRRLPEKTPTISTLFPKSSNGKRTWIGWLSHYPKGGHHPLRKQRDARFIYNQWWNAPTLIWLAEAAGVDQRRIQKAAKVALRGKNSKGKAEAIRQLLPWELVARHLQLSNGRKATQRHFVAYHNSDEYGPYFRKSKTKEASFFTAKPFREDTLVGQHLWAFEGRGSPRSYRLVSHGIITRLNKERRPAGFRKANRQYGTRVCFKADETHRQIDVTKFPWFRKLLRQQQSFRNGFNPLNDRAIIQALEQIEYNGHDTFRDDEADDVKEIKKTIKRRTTREALIDARLGQGNFRAEVEKRWNNVCALTGCGIAELLRASHIKPWKASSNPERLDPENGLLLAAHVDALFDRGLITFANNGAICLGNRIDAGERKRLHLPARLRRKPTKTERQFLDYHRIHVFDQG